MNATQLKEKTKQNKKNREREERELEFADDKVIHCWVGDKSLCGATQVNHNCRNNDGSPIWQDFKTEVACPMCLKPLCPFCALLVGTWK